MMKSLLHYHRPVYWDDCKAVWILHTTCCTVVEEWHTVRNRTEFVLINQRWSNYLSVSEHSMQNNSVAAFISKYFQYISAAFCWYDFSLCRCICQALGTSSIIETHRKIFPGHHMILQKHIYYTTIAFCSCRAEKMHSMPRNQQMSAVLQQKVCLFKCTYTYKYDADIMCTTESLEWSISRLGM